MARHDPHGKEDLGERFSQFASVCGIIDGHVDAGKTTLSEAMLYRCGCIRRLGRVDHQDAFLDTYALERERGITIFSKQAVLPLGEAELQLLDTPGHGVVFGAEDRANFKGSGDGHISLQSRRASAGAGTGAPHTFTRTCGTLECLG